MAHLNHDYFRSIIFGVQDSLVSTTGLIVGITAGSHDRRFIILAALVALAVEAVSMASGQFLSEESIHRLEKNHHDNLLFGAFLMFISYYLAGLVPILPVLVIPLNNAIAASLLSSFIALFFLGYLKAKYTHQNPKRTAMEVLLVGGLSSIVGLLAGTFIS